MHGILRPTSIGWLASLGWVWLGLFGLLGWAQVTSTDSPLECRMPMDAAPGLASAHGDGEEGGAHARGRGTGAGASVHFPHWILPILATCPLSRTLERSYFSLTLVHLTIYEIGPPFADG